MKQLYGIVAPISSIFEKDGAFAPRLLAQNVERYAASGIHGYLALGSNGENKLLTWDEKLEALKIIVEGKAPGQFVMAGSIFESTAETIAFAKEAVAIGADYISLLPPSYFKSQMKDAALVRYFTDVASAVGAPVVLYKAPQFSGGVDIGAAVLAECVKHPNIAGIKDSSSSGIEKLLGSVPESFRVLSGTANTFVSALLNGAVGGVLSLANCLPGLALDVFNAFNAGDYPKLIRLNKAMIRLNGDISGKYGVAGVKYAMELNGFHGGDPRLPLLPLSDADKGAIRKALAGYAGA